MIVGRLLVVLAAVAASTYAATAPKLTYAPPAANSNLGDASQDTDAGCSREAEIVRDVTSDIVITKKPLKMTVDPKKLEDGDDLTVSWKSFTDAHKKDYLTLVCGPAKNANDYLFQAAIKSDKSITFARLPHLRCDYSAIYYNYNEETDKYTPIANVTIPMKDHPNKPKQGHIALTENDDEMVVMYNSATDCVPNVRYGLTNTTMTNVATGTSTTYKASDMCHAPATVNRQSGYRNPGYMHKVFLKKLSPGKKYYYQFGDDNNGWSKIFSFKSRPKKSTKSTGWIGYGDMGYGGLGSDQTAKRARKDVDKGYDGFLLHYGDVSYARGHGYVWDSWFRQLQPLAARIPYMVGVGNHEYDYTSGGFGKDPSGYVTEDGKQAFKPSWANFGTDSGGECTVPLVHRFHAPQTGHGLFWYSFNYAGIHVIQLSSEHDWQEGSDQYKWFEKDLKAVDRKDYPWIIVTMHRMVYSSQKGISFAIPDRMKNALEPLLVQYKVNLVMQGHQHSYERTCPVINGKCVAGGKAPVHIIVGSAGADINKAPFLTARGNYSVKHAGEYGYLRAKSTAEEMKIEFVLHKNGSVWDKVTLKPYN